LRAAENATALESRTLDDPRLKSFFTGDVSAQNASGAETTWDLANLTLARFFTIRSSMSARAKLASGRGGGDDAAAQIPNPSLGLDIIHNGTGMPL